MEQSINNNTNNGEWWTEIVPGVKVRNYFTYVTSGSTLSIVAQRNSGTQRGCITAVIIEELFVARNPDPADGALDVALDKVMTWTAGSDPKRPDTMFTLLKARPWFLPAMQASIAA
jgi:hypothetical protein